MSYCYADDDTSSQHSYLHIMPESPLQNKLSTTTQNYLRRGSSDMSPSTQLEQEKRVRREIANSNERRRMQSINTGFQSLKILIPHSCGEKLSKACILQRAADHIKSLETEKLKLQSQNEQFRILIKSFQIDSTSVLQAQRHLSTNELDETKAIVNNIYDDVKNAHIYWNAQYIQPTKDDQSSSQVDKFDRCSIPKQSSPTTTSDTTHLIVKESQPSQRIYKTNSLDQATDKDIVTVERCQMRTQSVDTPNTVSRPNLQTIVEAIRHLEGDDVLSNISPPALTRQQEDLPAQLKAMINEKFQQTTSKNLSSHASIFQQTMNIYDVPASTSVLTHEIDLHQKPPKKRKITFNESEDTLLQKQDIPPISSSDVHHLEQISSESSSTTAQYLQEHFIQRIARFSPN